jgi:hypothetical protein
MPKNTAGLKRGGPGRKPGVPNKVTQEVRDLAESLINDDAYLAKLRAQLRAGKCNPAVVTMLWHYRYGKPKDTVEITGENGGPISVIRRVIVDPDESE